MPHSGPGLFAVAKIWFFSQGETYMFWTQPVFTCSKWTVNTIEYVSKKLKKLWNLFEVNSKDEGNWRRLIRRRSSHPRGSIKSCSEKFRNFHRKTPALESLFKSCRILGLQLYWKRLQHRCFPVNIAKFLRTPILKNIYQRLLL